MSTSGNGSSSNGPGETGFPPAEHPEERAGSNVGVWVGVIAAVVVVAVAGVFLIAGLGSDDGEVTVVGGDETTAPAEPTDTEPTDTEPTDTEPTGDGDNGATTDPAGGETTDPEQTGTETGAAPSPDPTDEADPTDPEADPVRDTIGRYDPQDPLAIGDIDAPVILVEYGDYQCPYCMLWAATYKPDLMPLVEDGTLRIEYHDFIIFGEESELIAAAARAAGEQDMFWDYYDAIAERTPQGSGADPDRAGLIALAEEIGVPDLEQFETDLDSPGIRNAIAEDHNVGVQAGVRGTPTLVLNEERLETIPELADLIDQIEDEAAGTD